MEVPGHNGFRCDEEKALKSLLDAFGSAFSLEEIASAYCKASRNADLAGEILYDMQRSLSTSTTLPSSSDTRAEESSESLDGFSFKNSYQEKRNLRTLKPKVRPVSVGTVSSFLGKDYVRSVPSRNGYYPMTKPVKLDSKVLPMSEIWVEKCKPNIAEHDQLHQDMEDFLFKMLGDGFQLDRDTIREVLDNCGYDMKKSMEKLLDQSIVTLEKKTDVVGDSARSFTDMNPNPEVSSPQRKFQNVNDPRGSRVSNKRVESHGQGKERDDLQKEVLASLFNACEHPETSKRTVKKVKKRSSFGQVVVEPPEDSMKEYNIDINCTQQQNVDDADEEDDYQSLRRAVKEYRATMNEYYKAAVDAFANGDHDKADKLLDQGQFFQKRAHEADEESSKMLLETKTTEGQEMLLDLHEHDKREAIRLLECHLSTLSGIPSIKYLKVIIDANDQDTPKGSRRRRIMKLLKEEPIEWIEGETAGTILIRLDNIDRRRLSFLKK